MTAIQRTRTARRDRDETSVVVWLHGCLMDAQMAISTTRAVDEAIGSMRDSAGPSMRKTFARPACETALPTFPGQQTACPPQALPPCAARVLPSQYIPYPPMGRLSAAQGIVQCGRAMCPCVVPCPLRHWTALSQQSAVGTWPSLATLTPPTCARLAHRGCGKDR
jgi:hypothetical protein